MAEEHGFQSQEGHRLCANNCGFFGSPATQNYCSKCYHEICLKEEQKSPEKSINSHFPAPASSSAMVLPEKVSIQPDILTTPAEAAVVTAERVEVEAEITVATVEVVAAQAVVQPQVVAQPNRCMTCRKKVGLVGFKCKCGTTFCGAHRYPELHGCTFDFKSTGREAIAKANPLVIAKKLDKI